MIKFMVFEKQELSSRRILRVLETKKPPKGGSWSTAKRGAFADP